MNFWSEGLGDLELVMGLDRSKLQRQGDHILLTGVVDAPAPWEYEVRVQYDDWLAILRTATRPETGGFIAREVSLGSVADMAVSIVRFVVLLAWHRLLRVTGVSRAGPAAPADVKSGSAPH